MICNLPHVSILSINQYLVVVLEWGKKEYGGKLIGEPLALKVGLLQHLTAVYNRCAPILPRCLLSYSHPACTSPLCNVATCDLSQLSCRPFCRVQVKIINLIYKCISAHLVQTYPLVQVICQGLIQFIYFYYSVFQRRSSL